MASYLVTGGLGFIGSHLAAALSEAGHRVRILDDLSTGRRENAPDGAEIIIADVAEPAAVGQAMAGMDGCFHLAAVASVEKSHEDWLGTHRSNLTGTIAVLDAARTARNGTPVPVVYASSAAVYGDNPHVPLVEDAATVPLSAYGADKLGSELHAAIATRVHGIPTTGLRLFNVFGPRQDPASPYSGVIAIFARRLANAKPLIIHGDGTQTRDFIYVGDVVRFFLAAMERMSEDAAIYNICTGRAVSVRELAETMAEVQGCKADLQFGPARAGDIHTSLGDPSRAIAALGIKAETPFARGLEATLAWMLEDAG